MIFQEPRNISLRYKRSACFRARNTRISRRRLPNIERGPGSDDAHTLRLRPRGGTMRTTIGLAVLAGAVLLSATARAQTEIQWWHSMQGALNDKLNELASGFNASQKEYKVVAIFKGQYPES